MSRSVPNESLGGRSDGTLLALMRKSAANCDRAEHYGEPWNGAQAALATELAVWRVLPFSSMNASSMFAPWSRITMNPLSARRGSSESPATSCSAHAMDGLFVMPS